MALQTQNIWNVNYPKFSFFLITFLMCFIFCPLYSADLNSTLSRFDLEKSGKSFKIVSRSLRSTDINIDSDSDLKDKIGGKGQENRTPRKNTENEKSQFKFVRPSVVKKAFPNKVTSLNSRGYDQPMPTMNPMTMPMDVGTPKGATGLTDVIKWLTIPLSIILAAALTFGVVQDFIPPALQISQGFDASRINSFGTNFQGRLERSEE